MPLFGTDGIRGRYPEELTPNLITRVGAVMSHYIDSDVAIGYDSRKVGTSMIQDLLVGLDIGFSKSKSPGLIDTCPIDIFNLGVASTPLIAYVSTTKSVWGIAVTASHNPHPYCGLKIFAPGGKKLSHKLTDQISQEIYSTEKDAVPKIDAGRKKELSKTWLEIPKAQKSQYLLEYLDWIKNSIAGRDLGSLNVLVDSANGAVSNTVETLLSALGVRVELICSNPDGFNINLDCGSSHPQKMLEEISNANVDLGLMLDGDGDRLLACIKVEPKVGQKQESSYRAIDGDEILAILALDYLNQGILDPPKVVTTKMANSGFVKAMLKSKISVEIADIGDINVSSTMQSTGAVLGGEQSGHIILGNLSQFGDGLLTAVHLLDVVKRSQKSLGELAMDSMTHFPQVQKNVAIATPGETLVSELEKDISSLEAKLDKSGRILVRPSGTEPVLRILIEGEDLNQIEMLAREFVQKVKLADQAGLRTQAIQ